MLYWFRSKSVNQKILQKSPLKVEMIVKKIYFKAWILLKKQKKQTNPQLYNQH